MDGKERIVSFGPAQAIEFKPGEAPLEAPEVGQDEGVVIHEEDVAPIYDLESAREFHVGSEEVAEPNVVKKEE